MKKHPFLKFEFVLKAKLPHKDQRAFDELFHYTSIALEIFLKKKRLIVAPLGKVSLSVSILICGDKRIRTLNKSYRHKDKVTDVLSFPSVEEIRKLKKLSVLENHLFLGDIAICYPQLIRQANKFGITHGDEFVHLLVHGLLHLLGYDHELSKKEEKLMEELEKAILEKISKIKKKGA